METRELNQESRGRADHEIKANDFARLMRTSEAPVEVSEQHRLGREFVELGRLQRRLQGDARQRPGIGVMKRNGPGQLALFPPATARGEASQAADGMTQRDPGSENVRSRQKRELIAAHIEERERDRQD